MSRDYQHWLVLKSWERLHYPRVDEVEWWPDDHGFFGTGKTVCGRYGELMTPGFISRLGLPRCAHCCRIRGVPRGQGDPINDQCARSL